MLKSAKLLTTLLWPRVGLGLRYAHCVVMDKYPQPFRTFLATLPQPETTTLCNGIKVVSEFRENCHATIGIFIDGGSRYEDNFNNGIAHFYEHIAFKGSESRTKQAMDSQISSTGARFKSFTTREMCGYYAECLCEDATFIVDVLADGLFCNKLDYEEIELSKNILYLEMSEHDRNLNKILYDYLHATAFQGTSLAQSVVGPSNNLYHFCESTIKQYRDKFFLPPRMMIAAVGGVPHSHLVHLAETYFGHLTNCSCFDRDIYRFTGSQVMFRDDSRPMANVAIAVEIPSFCSNDMYILDIARTIVGSWDQRQPCGDKHANFLAQSSCELHTSAYKSFMINYKDCGLWGIQYMCEPKHLENMTESVCSLWMNLCRTTVDCEVDRAKRQVKAKLLAMAGSTTARCMDLARWTLYDGYVPALMDRIKAIEQVDCNDIRDRMTRYLYDKSPAIAAVGPTEGLPEYNRILSSLYWLRW